MPLDNNLGNLLTRKAQVQLHVAVSAPNATLDSVTVLPVTLVSNWEKILVEVKPMIEVVDNGDGSSDLRITFAAELPYTFDGQDVTLFQRLWALYNYDPTLLKEDMFRQWARKDGVFLWMRALIDADFGKVVQGSVSAPVASDVMKLVVAGVPLIDASSTVILDNYSDFLAAVGV